MRANNTRIIIRHSLSKKRALLFSLYCLSGALIAQTQQTIYDNFEGDKFLFYGERIGVLDTLAKNPAPNKVNSSAKCGLYVRNGAKKFANIKMNLPLKLNGVDAYATYLGVPPKIKMKIFTGAPAGTLVEILLGSRRGNNDYPAGTHSQYQAYTTKSNQWEELEFKFSQIPQGSETSASQIDQIVLLFNPNSSNSDTYYFDDLTGPAVLIHDKEDVATPDKNSEDKSTEKLKDKNPSDKINKPLTKKGIDKKADK